MVRRVRLGDRRGSRGMAGMGIHTAGEREVNKEKERVKKMDIQQIESTEDNEETIFDILEDIRGAVETLHFQRKIVCEAKDCVYRLNNGQCKFNFISIG